MNRMMLSVLAAGMAYGGVIVADRQYRFCQRNECELYCGGGRPACRTPGAGQEALPLVERTDAFTMAFVEYQANGAPWDPTQILVAKALIQEARRASAQPGEAMGPVTVFLYVHG